MPGTLGPGIGYGKASRFVFTATAGQVTFSGPDSSPQAITLTYTPGYVEVAVNGRWLPPQDYVATNGSSIVLNSGCAAGDIVYAYALSTFSAVNSMLTTGGQTITGGFTFTPFSIGNIAAAFTPNPSNGNYQFGTNHNAATWSAPSTDCAIDILVTNDATAGAITFSGFTVGANTGDALTTTNGNKFIISIRRINAISTYIVKALQ